MFGSIPRGFPKYCHQVMTSSFRTSASASERYFSTRSSGGFGRSLISETPNVRRKSSVVPKSMGRPGGVHAADLLHELILDKLVHSMVR